MGNKGEPKFPRMLHQKTQVLSNFFHMVEGCRQKASGVLFWVRPVGPNHTLRAAKLPCHPGRAADVSGKRCPDGKGPEPRRRARAAFRFAPKHPGS